MLRAHVLRRVGSDKGLCPWGLRDRGSAITTPLPVWCGYLFHGTPPQNLVVNTGFLHC